jgi:hypothetical protein
MATRADVFGVKPFAFICGGPMSGRMSLLITGLVIICSSISSNTGIWKWPWRVPSTRSADVMAEQLNVRGVKAFLFPMAPSSCWSRLRFSMMLTRFGLYGGRYMRRLHQDLLVSEPAVMVGVAFRAPFDCPTGSITSTTSYSSIQTASVSKSCSFEMLPATDTRFEAYH